MPPKKKQKLTTVPLTSLMNSSCRQRSFLWVIWDFHQWPAGEGFHLKSSIFTLDGNKFQIGLDYKANFLEPSLHLMTKPSQPLSTHIKFSIVGVLFRRYHASEKPCVFRHLNQICHFPKFVSQHNVLDKDKKVCLNGDLLLLCEMTFFEFDSHYFEACASPDLVSNMRHLLENKVYTDCVIHVKDRHFMCHKAVLSCRSEFFRDMFHSNMKEKRESTLTISDIDPFIVQKLLQYIYTGHVDILPSDAFLLFSAAHRYHLERLQSLCEKELNLNLWEGNALSIYKLASVFNVPGLKVRAERLLQGFKNEVGGWHYYNAFAWDVDRSNDMIDVVGSSGLSTNDSRDEQMQPVIVADSERISMHDKCDVRNILHQVSISGEIPSNKETLFVISDVHTVDDTAGPSTARQFHHREKCAIKRPPRPEDVPPDADVWCCTKNHTLSKMKWRIRGMDKICHTKTLDIKSLTFYSKDKDTNVTAAWQVEISIIEVQNLPRDIVYLSLRLTCITSSIAEITVEYKFTLLSIDNVEKHSVNGIRTFKENSSVLVSRYYLRIDDILQYTSYLHNQTDLILCCQLMKRKSFLFDTIEPIVVPKCDLSTDILWLLTSKSYCDVVISVDNVSFECHKAILTVASPYLAEIFEGQHKCHRLFKIPDIKADAFEVLQWFIYSGVCKECDELKVIPEANKFGLTDMKNVLEQRIISNLCIENAAKLLVFADTNTCSKLRAECLQFISLYLKEVMSTTGWLDVAKNDKLQTECLKTPYTGEGLTDNEMIWLGINQD